VTDTQKTPESQNDERLSAALYRALGEAGMRLPRTAKEVEAAEQWVREHGPEVPASLKSPSIESLLNSARLDNERRLDR
jgi:hypothetical protein